MKVLVCGGRLYGNSARVFEVLDHVHKHVPISLIIQGGAEGADRFAEEWAREREVNCLRVPAKWRRLGKDMAGSARNREMVLMYPDEVVAFPGQHGTMNMVMQAVGRMIPTHTIDWCQSGRPTMTVLHEPTGDSMTRDLFKTDPAGSVRALSPEGAASMLPIALERAIEEQ